MKNEICSMKYKLEACSLKLEAKLQPYFHTPEKFSKWKIKIFYLSPENLF
jgi:hypothetical protein